MDLEALLAPDAGTGLGPSRARVLELLRETESPLGVQDIADRTGLHPNTARFHLDGLVEAGLATREPQARAAVGRPSMAYRAAGHGPAGPRRYRLLAEMLTSLITGLMAEPGEAAAAAGREWGAYLTEPPPPYQRLGASESLARLTAILAELGFAPQLAAEGDRLPPEPARVPVQGDRPAAPGRGVRTASRAHARRAGPAALRGHRRPAGAVRGAGPVRRAAERRRGAAARPTAAGRR